MRRPPFSPSIPATAPFGLLIGCLGALLATALSIMAATPNSLGSTEQVGHIALNRMVTPVHQIVTPAGVQVDLPGLRPQAIALSPNGRLLVTAGKTSELLVVDPATGKILQRVALPSEKQNEPQPEVVSPNILQPDAKGQVSFTGLVFSPDGKRIYLSNVNGSVKVFALAPDDKVTGSHSIPLPLANALRRKEEIPSGLAVSLDGSRLYVAFNLSNQLGEFDVTSGKLLRTFEVGVAPYDVAIAAGNAYVSNWGGRRPQPGDTTGPAGRGTEVRVDPVTHIASEGSVTVIDLASGKVRAEVLVHRHASALAVTPDFRHVVCANAADDNLSVIDTATDKIVETIWVKQSPTDLFGASPNALAFDAKGKTLYVANGTQNAIAVVDFKPGESKLVGLIPVGWFPGAITFHAARNLLCVANIKGLPTTTRVEKQTGKPGFNSHQYSGSLSLVPVPPKKALPALSAIVWKNYRREQLAVAKLPPRPGQPARPVPERIGEPSVFKHVVYIIKENRTYDQVLGDMKPGNGDPSLCIFPDRITPNQHKLAREFVLLDNTYCSGILSADGHQWSTTAFATDYMEKSFAGFPRSYPDGMGEDEMDALAYAPTGFLWDNVLKHGKTLRNYGEFALPAVRWADAKRKGSPKWMDCWKEYQEKKGEVIFASKPAVKSLAPHLATNTVGWDMAVPDLFRADFFINELKQYEAKGGFPNLVIICLPNDHTSGTSAGSPTPAACVADNDLAFGRIVEAISRSKFWKETAIFAIEDDPQAGYDHVSGYRTTAYCISPYTKRGAVVSTQYNTTSMIRTMEQILGLPPMNQFDATASPMFDCFTETPNFTPFNSVPSNVPLDQMNVAANSIKDPLLRQHAHASARLNFKQPDKCPEDLLNRILWHAMKGSAAPYPTWAITAGAKDWDD